MSTALPGLRIGGVPVTVHPSFFLTALVLAFSLTGVSLEATILLMAIWVMVLLVAVIAHEMGHALVFRVMGVPSRIDVHSMGGTTTPLRGTALTPMRSFLVSLAGPLTGIGLALAIGGLLRVPGVSDLDGFLRYGVEQLLAVNLGLSLFNLLPIYPMDGAQATGAILRVVARRRADEAAIVVSTAAAAIVVAVALATRHSWIALVTALIWMWGFSAQRRTFATRGDEPLRGTLTGAADALTRRDWRAAVDGARQVISQRPSPDLRRKAATILTLAGIAARDLGVAEQGLRSFPRGAAPGPYLEGWVALLAGDAERAIALLIDAFSLQPDDGTGSALVHAYLKAGNADEAIRFVTGPQAPRLGPAAHAALVDGLLSVNPELAGQLGEAAFTRWADGQIAYGVARSRALRGDTTGATDWLQKAVEAGFRDRLRLLGDPDLATVRGTPAYERALAAMGEESMTTSGPAASVPPSPS